MEASPGSFHAMVALPSPAVAVNPVGAPGGSGVGVGVGSGAGGV